MAALARQAITALNREKPHSSITDWIEILTSSRYEVEAYDGIPEIVDSMNLQASGPAEAFRAIRKKLKHGDTHHQLRALVILKALVENCGSQLQPNFADDRFTDAIRRLATDPTTDSNVKKKLLIVLASWKCQFHDDPKMKLIASLIDQCKLYSIRRSEDMSDAHSTELGAKERVRELERERERGERKIAKHSRDKEKITKAREIQGKKQGKEHKSREAKRPIRRAFNIEQEKLQILNCIATASQCSSNLSNALMLANPQQEPMEINIRVQECLGATKKVRKELLRYIQLVEDEELIGTLLEINERIVQALDTYDKYLIPDFDAGLVAQPQTTLANGNTSAPELTKLQGEQHAAIAKVQMSPASKNVHPDLQELGFGALGSDAACLPSPIRPSSPDSLEDDERRGSLSDFSSYMSSDETNNSPSARESFPDKGKGRASQGRYHTDSSAKIAKHRPLLIDDSDPFADPV